jgi:hypothetical protein
MRIVSCDLSGVIDAIPFVRTCKAEEVLRASKQTKLRSRMNSPYIYQRHSLITQAERNAKYSCTR